MNRIELESAAQVHTVLALCRSKGLDPVQVLDQARMLRHMGTRREDAVRVLENAIAVIEGTPDASEMAGMKTPLDLKRMIIEKLRGIQSDIEKHN